MHVILKKYGKTARGKKRREFREFENAVAEELTNASNQKSFANAWVAARRFSRKTVGPRKRVFKLPALERRSCADWYNVCKEEGRDGDFRVQKADIDELA